MKTPRCSEPRNGLAGGGGGKVHLVYPCDSSLPLLVSRAASLVPSKYVLPPTN